MANPEHVKIVKRGAAAIAEWRWQDPRRRLDLSEADLSRAELGHADLSQGDLTDADLIGANLLYANLQAADLPGADLSGANLQITYLRGADLRGANLCGANLRGADLIRANLFNADLARTTCFATAFADCDLSEVRGLQSVRHEGPSTISVETLVRTLEGAGGQFTAEQRTFFENTGVPRTLLDYLPDLLETQPIQFFSCFISYGGQDGEFADRLHRDMRRRDIRCWKYDVDAIIGRDVWGNISGAIVLHEKMIVICSQSSLQRPGVHGEIERALQKEEQLKRERSGKGDAHVDTDVLVPVRLDDYVFEGWEHPRKAELIAKHIGDFRDWEDDANYQRGLEQLLRALDPRSKLGLS